MTSPETLPDKRAVYETTYAKLADVFAGEKPNAEEMRLAKACHVIAASLVHNRRATLRRVIVEDFQNTGADPDGAVEALMTPNTGKLLSKSLAVIPEGCGKTMLRHQLGFDERAFVRYCMEQIGATQ